MGPIITRCPNIGTLKGANGIRFECHGAAEHIDLTLKILFIFLKQTESVYIGKINTSNEYWAIAFMCLCTCSFNYKFTILHRKSIRVMYWMRLLMQSWVKKVWERGGWGGARWKESVWVVGVWGGRGGRSLMLSAHTSSDCSQRRLISI